MSEPGSPNFSQAVPDPSTLAAIASEINTLFEQLKAKKAEFDTAVSAASTHLSDETQKAQTLGAQAESLRTEISNSKSALEADRESMSSIIEKAKVSGQEIETIKTSVATAKGAVEVLQQSATNDQASIGRSKAEIESLQTAAVAKAEKLSNEHSGVASQIADLSSQQVALQELLKNLSDSGARAEAHTASIKSVLDDVEKCGKQFASLKTSSEEQYDALVAKQKSLQAKIDEVIAANDAIVVLRRKLLEGTDDAKSVSDEVMELQKNFNTVLSQATENRDEAAASLQKLTETVTSNAAAQKIEWDEKFGKLYESMKTQILSLLPSAGAAGLAWTYFDAKSRYAPTPFRGSPSATETQRPSMFNRVFGYNAQSWIATVFFYGLFIVPLLLIAAGSYQLVYQIEFQHMPIPDIRILGLRVLIGLPLVALSTFGLVSLRLYRKLYEQYNHKQRVMELYVSFKREIEANGADDQKKKLISIMLDSVAEKAWKIDRPDKEEKDDENLPSLESFADWASRIKAIFH
ncbi:MAG: hypothetical protein JO261_10025 [Alphaproteobacteria bacterium]|nr:hypothetical protein [Alphaproteobacteria bacterium]MBV9694026.1 hypothetical protein [Alphaproteobacteria bacterium]